MAGVPPEGAVFRHHKLKQKEEKMFDRKDLTLISEHSLAATSGSAESPAFDLDSAVRNCELEFAAAETEADKALAAEIHESDDGETFAKAAWSPSGTIAGKPAAVLRVGVPSTAKRFIKAKFANTGAACAASFSLAF